MSQDENAPTIPVPIDPDAVSEDVPGLCPEVENDKQGEFETAIQALDGRGQRVVGQILAGARTTGVAEKISAGEVEVLSGGIVTSIKRGDGVKGTGNTGGALAAAMRLAGIDETHLSNVLSEGLKAKKTVRAGAGTKKVPDYAIRIRYLELAHRLRGDLAKEAAGGGEMKYEERIKLIMKGEG